MRLLCPLLIIFGHMPGAMGAEVKWRAAGTVASVVGVEFAALVAESDAVVIEFSYDNRALREPQAIREQPNPFGDGLLWSQWEYREGVNIDLKVTIGASNWHGTLNSGIEGTPRTIEVQDFSIGPSSSPATFDFFKINVSGADGGQFSSFPGAEEGDTRALRLEFNDASADAAGPDYLGSIALACVSQSVARLTSARGVIEDGAGSVIEFTIDPASIRTELVGVRAIRLSAISFENDQVTLTWPSEPGRFYIIQYLDAFLCWRELTSVFAIDEVTTESFFPFGSGVPRAQIYRVAEDEE